MTRTRESPPGVVPAHGWPATSGRGQVSPGLRRRPPPELLAPAGGPEAGYAALQYGADAIYLGLGGFSARAEAENFTPDQLAAIAACARSLTPRRRVYVTVNTVVQQRELGRLVDALWAVAEAGADAVIVQDLGVWRLVRTQFPGLRLHASTQMAIHNVEGARWIAGLGAARVTLARELTLGEVREVVDGAGIEVEVFVHGALCYCYSGLCLFSAHTTGRSANRGRCAYPCRDRFQVEVGGAASEGHVFSMKDLALGADLAELCATGVHSLKIEGRKKSALYVATVTDYYRRLLDGRLDPAGQREREEQIRTVFSRPWTRLFTRQAHARDVIDPERVGHRGARIGAVEGVASSGGRARLRVTVQRAVEEHDGLQIDVEGLSRPFGFAVANLRVRGDRGYRQTFTAPAGAAIEVDLPPGYPHLPAGAPVYLASSMAVKRTYPLRRPRPGEHRLQFPVAVVLTVSPSGLAARAQVERPPGGALPEGGPAVSAEARLEGPFDRARDVAAVEGGARQAFEKTGDTPFGPVRLAWENPDGCFVPVSRLNALRRDLLAELAQRLDGARAAARAAIAARVQADAAGACSVADGGASDHPAAVAWSLRTAGTEALGALTEADWEGVEEVVIAIDNGPAAREAEALLELAGRVGRDRIRLGLPTLLRAHDRGRVLPRVAALLAAGWRRWEVANPWGWMVLREAAGGGALDVSADWPLYCLNGLAARQWLESGATRVTFSPEDDRANWLELLARVGSRAVALLYQDSPLFVAEACPRGALAGGCRQRGAGHCAGWEGRATSSRGQSFRLINRHGRTTVVGAAPFCAADRLAELAGAGLRHARADFGWRAYAPEELAAVWRQVRAGRAPAVAHAGNLQRGLA